MAGKVLHFSLFFRRQHPFDSLPFVILVFAHFVFPTGSAALTNERKLVSEKKHQPELHPSVQERHRSGTMHWFQFIQRLDAD
jgi:hypothetical protein